jgi:RNA polymerase sigma factor (sigma-70 family)
MADRQLRLVIDHLREMIGARGAGAMGDAQLLDRFLAGRDELAIETLVRRHGPMVLRVCRRVLHDAHEAEDAFQATFLVFVRKARSISKQASLGSWLYKVAYRIALRARARAAQRAALSSLDADLPAADHGRVAAETAWRELRPILDEEVNRLPAKYRTPVVLCYLEGKAYQQAAAEIGCPKGTVSIRLTRARDLLRKRLARRGFAMPAMALSTLVAEKAAAALPAGLVDRTIRAALTGIVSEPIRALAHGVLRTMFLNKIKTIGSVVFSLLLLAATGAVIVHGVLAGQQAAQPEGNPSLAAAAKLDLHGDPLPAGAIGRLSTSRLRQVGLGGPYYEPGTVAFLPDGKSLFSAGCWWCSFWDPATGKKTGGIDFERDKTKIPQYGTMAACALAPDSKTLALTMRYEGTIRLLDAATGKELRRFEGHARGSGTRSVTRIDFSPDGKLLASVATDGTLRLWEAATGKEVRKLQPFDPVKQIAVGLLGDINPWVKFSPDSRMLVSKDGGNVRLWEVATGKEIRKLALAQGGPALVPQGQPPPPKAQNGVSSGSPQVAAFSPDSKVVAVGHAGFANAGVPALGVKPRVFSQSSVSLWDALTGKSIRVIVVPAPVLALAFSPDGKMLAAAGGSMPFRGLGVTDREANDFGIQLYDSATGKLIHQLAGHNRAVYSLAFSPDGKTLASAAGDSTIRLWDPATGKEIPRGGHGNEITVEAVAFSADGKTVASGQGKTIALWEAATGKLIRRIAGPPPLAKSNLPVAASQREKVWSLAFSPDGKTLASGSGDTSIYLWDPATGKEIRRIDGHKHWVRSVAFSPDGKTLASGSEDKTVRLWDPATGKEIRQLAGHGHGVRSVAFSRDGKMLASGSEHTISLHDPATGKPIPHHVGKLSYDLLSLALSPDGKTVALGAGHGAFDVVLLDLATGNELGRGPVKDAIWSVAFSPDGKTVASGSHSHEVCLWEAATAREIVRLDGKQGPVFCVAFSPDGKTLVSGGEDTTVLVWDVNRVSTPAGGPAKPTDKKPAKPRDDAKPAQPRDQTPADPELAHPADKEPVDLPVATAQEVAVDPASPTDKEAVKGLEPLWAALLSPDPGRAYEAIAALVAVPNQAVPFLQERLLVPPPPPPDPQQLTQWIADLDSDQFAVRQNATVALEKIGPAAEPALRKALAGNLTLDMRRRLERLLERAAVIPPEDLRQLRAIQVLEYAGTPEAKRLLERLAKGPEDARLTREAQASLGRLRRHAGAP